MSSERGWFSQPGRHSLASKGIQTTFENIGRYGGIHKRGNYKQYSNYEKKLGEIVNNIHFILGETYRAVNDKQPRAHKMQNKVSELYTIIDEKLPRCENEDMSQKSKESITENSDRLMQEAIPDKMDVLESSDLPEPVKELVEQCYVTLYNIAYMGRRLVEAGQAQTARKSLRVEVNKLENYIEQFVDVY